MLIRFLNILLEREIIWQQYYFGKTSLETNLRFRGCEVKYWNLPFTIEDCYEFQKVRCVGSETVLANPLKLFIFAIYNTLSCQIFDIVITLVLMRLINQGSDKILSVTASKFM